ncbi:MAG: hypothetical protein JOZ62_17310 [Acidobacteriaceae bacterium]|nr:hypothetical protein [Acidobacteriaceae bacterium]
MTFASEAAHQRDRERLQALRLENQQINKENLDLHTEIKRCRRFKKQVWIALVIFILFATATVAWNLGRVW